MQIKTIRKHLPPHQHTQNREKWYLSGTYKGVQKSRLKFHRFQGCWFLIVSSHWFLCLYWPRLDQNPYKHQECLEHWF